MDKIHGIRVNDTVIVAGSAGVVKCLVTEAIRGTATANAYIEVAPYGVASLDAAGHSSKSSGFQSCSFIAFFFAKS